MGNWVRHGYEWIDPDLCQTPDKRRLSAQQYANAKKLAAHPVELWRIAQLFDRYRFPTYPVLEQHLVAAFDRTLVQRGILFESLVLGKGKSAQFWYDHGYDRELAEQGPDEKYETTT
jgi:hypothetical protein